jgi:hypothetical protein
MNEIWRTPGWQWATNYIVDDVFYTHGIGSSGLYPAFNKARSMGMSVVAGHTHTSAGIWWGASPVRRFFGMNTGCGIDITKMEFEYGMHFARRPILGAGIVIDGQPYHEIMPIGDGERYHRELSE